MVNDFVYIKRYVPKYLLETYRTHKLPKPLEASSDVSRRFLRQISKLLQRVGLAAGLLLHV